MLGDCVLIVIVDLKVCYSVGRFSRNCSKPSHWISGWLARLINMVFKSKIPGSDV
jgi:hypothetical protein